LASALTGGFSNAILLWTTRLPGKRLGAIGVVLTIGGFMLQLIEPTFLLAYQPPTYGHTAAVLAVAWSPDGRHIASASADSTVQVWTIGQERNVLTYRGHYNEVGTFAWSPDSKYIVSEPV
jgi:WD40 repeat protein